MHVTDGETEASDEQNAFPAAVMEAAAFLWSPAASSLQQDGRFPPATKPHHPQSEFFPSPLVSKMEIAAASTSADYWEGGDGHYRYSM